MRTLAKALFQLNGLPRVPKLLDFRAGRGILRDISWQSRAGQREICANLVPLEPFLNQRGERILQSQTAAQECERQMLGH